MKFAHLKITQWRQFSDINIEWHPRLSVIAGANGTGKSTLLRILATHFGWPHPLLATPTLRDDGSLELFTGRRGERLNVGEIGYSDGSTFQLNLPVAREVSFQLSTGGQTPVAGLHIDSHRAVFGYRPVGHLPTALVEPKVAYQSFAGEIRSPLHGNVVTVGQTFRMKEAIISMAVFGPGNAHVQAVPAAESLFQEFSGLLRTFLPSNIGFLRISVRMPDVVLVTRSGEFLLDASSGGLMSLIELAWQLFLYSRDMKTNFTVSIDEPENHLHPSMQRSLMPRLLASFPSAQFIVATHSPFIVSSVRDSSVYALKHQPSTIEVEEGIRQQAVSSIRLDQVSKAGTASEILRDVLGVPVTMPEWAAEDLGKIAADFSIEKLDGQRIAALRERLDAAGLGEFYPDALRQIADQK